MTYPLPLALIQTALDWWSALSFAKSVYYGIGICAGLVALVLALLSFIGLEHHDAADALDASDGGGGGIFSIKPLTGFFLGFGWVGGLAMDAGLSSLAAGLCGLGAGGSIMAVIVLMFRLIMGMKSDGTARIEDAVGAVGTVYVSLPANRAPGGQVTVSFKNRQETYEAFALDDAAIPSGTKIRVRECIDRRTVRVEPL
jgi:hypothetical protein